MVNQLKIKIFADGADKARMLNLDQNQLIQGFTTNPTLIRKSGVAHYESFAKEIIKKISSKPVSFEVFADDFSEMKRQAKLISSWGENVYVKIPVTNSKGELSSSVIKELADEGVKQNITAIMTLEQVEAVIPLLKDGPASILSIFAGRIHDTGQDAQSVVKRAVEMVSMYPQIEILWASTREIWNLFQADKVGCHIITVTDDILKKIPLLGKSLNEYSRETVASFHEDAVLAGYSL